METFQQSIKIGFFQKQEKYFSIMPYGIKVFSESENSEYSFEKISKNTLLGQKKVKNKYIFIFLYFYLSLFYVSIKSEEAIIICFILITGFIFTYYYFWNREKTKLMLISDNKYIVFIYEHDNQVEVDNFISKIYKKRDEVLFKTYTSFTKFIPFQDQYEGLMFLLHEEIINQDEFYFHFGKLNETFEMKKID
ncbi:hypothetical protein [Emticicia sp. W12TSBA100-4]|uniref:hypothetical protein n=1 Tax=Emticicia sp. W12TSBA100-4 TaxID=3160965 RepID=UPI0033059EA5